MNGRPTRRVVRIGVVLAVVAGVAAAGGVATAGLFARGASAAEPEEKPVCQGTEEQHPDGTGQVRFAVSCSSLPGGWGARAKVRLNGMEDDEGPLVGSAGEVSRTDWYLPGWRGSTEIVLGPGGSGSSCSVTMEKEAVTARRDKFRVKLSCSALDAHVSVRGVGDYHLQDDTDTGWQSATGDYYSEWRTPSTLVDPTARIEWAWR